MSLDVLLVTDADDFESVLPAVGSLAHTMRRAPLADHVNGHSDKADVAIIDARDPQYYTGASTATGKRAGHIPGAGNLTFSTLAGEDGKLNSVEKLREQFSAAGVKPGDRVVSYCHIGQQATMVYFAARYLGFDARLYDGSWEDWSAHADWPAEVSKQ